MQKWAPEIVHHHQLPTPSQSGFRSRVGLCLILVILAIGTCSSTTRAAPSDPILVSTKINAELQFNPQDQRTDITAVRGVSQPGAGVTWLDGTGLVHYMPNANATGDDAFTLNALLKSGSEQTITVVVTIIGSPTGTEARGDGYTIDEDAAIQLYPLVNDAAGPGGGALTLSLQSQPEHGSAEAMSDGSILFTPEPNWYGELAWVYRASDGTTNKDAEIHITVTSVGDVPDAADDAVVIRQGASASIDILVNDGEADGDAFWLNDYSQPQFGTTQWSDSDRMILYIPNPDFAGVDQFTYSLVDQDGIDPATVTITVNGAPLAADDATAVEAGAAVTLDVLGNDADAEGDTLTISAVTQPAHGSATVNPDNTITYVANDDMVVSDSFSYSVMDAIGNSASANVAVQRGEMVVPLPLARDDEFLVLEDSVGNTLDLLSNDVEPNGGAMVLAIITSPEHGDLVVDAMQSVTYVPAPEFSGVDSFAYAVTGNGGTANALVSITVQPQNDVPIAAPDSAVTDEDVSIAVDVLANDSDIDSNELVVQSVTDGLIGTSSINADGLVVYTPNPNAKGSDQISYILSDGAGGAAMMTIDLVVNSVDDPPTAQDDSFSVDPGTFAVLDVAANDLDPDGDQPLTLSIRVDPKFGTASVDATGRITYTPTPGFEGFDSITYRITDPTGLFSEATATITIGDPNLKPVAVNDEVETSEGQAIRIHVVGNDSDPDGDKLSIYRVAQPDHGTTEIKKGRIVYRPDRRLHWYRSVQLSSD